MASTYDGLQTLQKQCLALVSAPLANIHDTTDVTAEQLRDVLATALLPGRLDLPLGGNWLTGVATNGTVSGVALAVHADGASTVPGNDLASEQMGIRWNNHATPDPIGTTFRVPNDMDVTQASTLNILAFKVGATVGDAVTWLVTAFSVGDADLSTADADFGGTSSAMTGDATSLTMQLETLALAANTMAVDDIVTLSIQPTDGTLGTDDVMICLVYVTYAKKLA